MTLQIVATIFIILCSLFSNGVCRVALVEQHGTTSIKTKNGQIFNCVPFHKQLAFSHPSSKFEVPTKIEEIQGRSKHVNFGLEGDGCPLGTVPILYGMDAKLEPTQYPPPRNKEHCHAVVRTRANGGRKIMGTQASISLHKPIVNSNQWSAGRIKLSNGGDSIEAGWMVNSKVFKDNEAHLYIKFSANGKQCINTQCPGYVQVDNRLPLGLVPKLYSQVGGDQFTWNMTIDKHQDDGNWWLSLIVNDKVPIGYWPKNLFSSPLAEAASQVEWGGEINNSGATDPQPQMGSGNTAEENTGTSAYFQQVTIVNGNFQKNQPDDTEKDADCPPYYTSLDEGYQGDYWGRLMYYGGTHIRG